MLGMLVAGVNFNGASIWQRPFDNGAIAEWTINGSQSRGNEFLLRFELAPYELTVFSDGRAIIKGTDDPAVARGLYAKYVGS